MTSKVYSGKKDLTCEGNRIINGEKYEQTFGIRKDTRCNDCGIHGCGNFYYDSGDYYCRNCIKNRRVNI